MAIVSIAGQQNKTDRWLSIQTKLEEHFDEKELLECLATLSEAKKIDFTNPKHQRAIEVAVKYLVAKQALQNRQFGIRK